MKKLLASLALTLCASSVHAVGMGRLTVLSALGQRLNVEIELISVDKQELGTLNAKLGAPRAYERSGLPMGAAATSGVRVSVEKRASGEPFIRVISTQPVNEPFINLVIELSSLSGPVTREFAVLLDPPEIMPAKPATAEVHPLAPAPEIKATPAAAPPARAAGSEYGPVRRGETLSRIAAKVRPPSASLEQTMLGLFRNNPSAFINNNMNLLKAGQRLRVPSEDQIAAVSQAESAKELRTQTAAWSASRQTTAAGDGSAPKPAATPVEAKPAATAKNAEAGRPVVKLSRSAPAGSKGATMEDRVRMLEEDLAARDRALTDANERIKRLEKAAAEAPAAGRPQ